MPGAPLDATRPVLFTIGYEGLVQPQLLDRLTSAGVACLLDVRAVPLSRKAGFSKTVLAASLHQSGIAYVHDRRLGTPKAGRQAAQRGRTAVMASVFHAHMQTAPAREGLAAALALAACKPVCLLCFEREPHACHRSIVAEMMGMPVHHL